MLIVEFVLVQERDGAYVEAGQLAFNAELFQDALESAGDPGVTDVWYAREGGATVSRTVRGRLRDVLATIRRAQAAEQRAVAAAAAAASAPTRPVDHRHQIY